MDTAQFHSIFLTIYEVRFLLAADAETATFPIYDSKNIGQLRSQRLHVENFFCKLE